MSRLHWWRQADRDEHCLGFLRLGALDGGRADDGGCRVHLCVANPSAQQIRVDAVGHCHRRHRHARLHAAGHSVCLEFVAVNATSPACAGLLIGDSAHVSTKSC